MALKPWYKVVNPLEDLREGKSLVVSEFAVHLDHIRDQSGHEDYVRPDRFFKSTYLTDGLISLASEVLRRLSGDTSQNAVFNMATQFGGGKTHALALLYHLASCGPDASGFMGVDKILEHSGLFAIPRAATAVFVGTEFDSISGRGRDGEPIRKTPWGEIAFQLAGAQGFQIVREHDTQLVAPGGDVIRALLPPGRPCLILIDELMNYVSRFRKQGLSDQLYNFIQNLSVVASGLPNVVVVISIPTSELERAPSPEDQMDFDRFKKVLDRVGKPVILSSDADISEIIRRRLFEWERLSPEGRVILDQDAVKTCRAYADWTREHKLQIPAWFDVDHAEEAFKATYPFHPLTISVFKRKWQSLPRFQRTRGVLRLLALWASKAFRDGWSGAHRDPLIGLGTAPLEDRDFRAAVLEQLGEQLLEVPITTDIVGTLESHAFRLDSLADETIKNARLHRKVATAIFFESNGGMTRSEEATLPEVRLAVGQPDLDIGNVETVLEALKKSCYYINERGSKFSVRPGINKIFADSRASVQDSDVDEKARQAILEVFNKGKLIRHVPFPEKSNEIPDQPALTLAVLSPEYSLRDTSTIALVEAMTREHGSSARFYKSALIWAIADGSSALKSKARDLLAWANILEEESRLQLDDSQKNQVRENVRIAGRELHEVVWWSYKNLALLDKDNRLTLIDLGKINSSAADSLTSLYLIYLRQKDLLVERVSPKFLKRNWPNQKEWSTKAVRDVFFASPIFPRLTSQEAVKDVIARGVSDGVFAYAGKSPEGGYDPLYYKQPLSPDDVEISDDLFLLKEPPMIALQPETVVVTPAQVRLRPGEEFRFSAQALDKEGREVIAEGLEWSSTGGTIDSLGMFRAGQQEGTFRVMASAGKAHGAATVDVLEEPASQLVRLEVHPQEVSLGRGDTQAFTAKGFDSQGRLVPLRRVVWATEGGSIDDSGFFRAGQAEGLFEVRASCGDLVAISKVDIVALNARWTGEVPHQRWSQFYNKVLMKHVMGKKLKLRVEVDLADATAEDVEQMRIGLQELGLDDNVQLS
ncbi:MAG TPA: DUF499 domain-containing protein [Methanothrix sp.]|nr:DUF499 domain-containing protein [Methanothrix sp.]